MPQWLGFQTWWLIEWIGISPSIYWKIDVEKWNLFGRFYCTKGTILIGFHASILEIENVINVSHPVCRRSWTKQIHRNLIHDLASRAVRSTQCMSLTLRNRLNYAGYGAKPAIHYVCTPEQSNLRKYGGSRAKKKCEHKITNKPQ